MSKRKAVFLGNGFTRALVGNVPAWGQLIGGANLEDDLQQIIPYTFQYEMNYLGERKSDEETLKSEICRKLPDFSKVELKGAAKSFLSFLAENEITDILTTNYDGLVEHLLLSQNAKLVSQNNSEKIYSIRRNYVYKYNEKLITLWKVHGDAVAPKSVMLGLDHYCGAIGKMDDFIKHGRLGGKTTDNPMEMKFPNKAKSDITKNKIETFQFQTWVDLFFVATVYFIGFGLDFSETDIWWLLNKRARFKEKLEISNEIFFYAPLVYPLQAVLSSTFCNSLQFFLDFSLMLRKHSMLRPFLRLTQPVPPQRRCVRLHPRGPAHRLRLSRRW